MGGIREFLYVFEKSGNIVTKQLVLQTYKRVVIKLPPPNSNSLSFGLVGIFVN